MDPTEGYQPIREIPDSTQEKETFARHIYDLYDEFKYDLFTVEQNDHGGIVRTVNQEVAYERIKVAYNEVRGVLIGDFFSNDTRTLLEQRILSAEQRLDSKEDVDIFDVDIAINILYDLFVLLSPDTSFDKMKKGEAIFLYETLYSFQYYPEIPHVLKLTGDHRRDVKRIERYEKKLNGIIDRDTSERRVKHAIEVLHKLDTNKARTNWFGRIAGAINNLIALNAFRDPDMGYALLHEADALRLSIEKRRTEGMSDVDYGTPVTKEDIDQGDDIARRTLLALYPDSAESDERGIQHLNRGKLEKILDIPSVDHLDYIHRLYSFLVKYKEYPSIRFTDNNEEWTFITKGERGELKAYADIQRFRHHKTNKLRFVWFTNVIGYLGLFLIEGNFSQSFQEAMRSRIKALKRIVESKRKDGITHDVVAIAEGLIVDVLSEYFHKSDIKSVREEILKVSGPYVEPHKLYSPRKVREYIEANGHTT